MALSKKEAKMLEDLQRKAEEPDAPSGNVSFTLDLSSDAAWERARKLGLVREDEPDDDDDDDEDVEDAPKRRGGGAAFFGGN